MAEMWISMGPQHPMTHGLWTLKVKVDGETVVDTEPDLGYIHRGVEKICEARDFTQITTYCDRLCYASANTWSHSYIYAAEDLLEVEVPERAEYIRLIAIEIQRIASHLMWLGAYGPDIGNLSITDKLKKFAPIRVVFGNIDNKEILISSGVIEL